MPPAAQPPSAPADETPPRPDPHRPRFHFTAQANWINDPNGLLFHDGRYHLHYQHNPGAAKWGDMHWGHASSADLVHWRDEPIALAPSTPDDADGCFSGCHALVDGVHTLFYTGYTTARQVQCVATSTDLRTWVKQPQRTLATPPAGVEPSDFRDPYVFQHDGCWYMVVGASLNHALGQALLYRSDDGVQWQPRGALFTATDARQGRMWECPNFLRIGEHWVLTVSLWPLLGGHAYVGRFENERFVPTWDGVLDVDAGAFAHLAMHAPDGRALQWAWMNEQREQSSIDVDGWAGAMTVPREVGVDALGRLTQRPVAEIGTLRGAPIASEHTGQAAGVLATFSGRHLDIEATFSQRDREKVGLALLTSPDGRETTRIVYWHDAQRLSVEREHSSLSPQARRQNVHAFLDLAPDEPLRLRVLLDASVLEVYANERLCLSTRVYPTLKGSIGASAFSDGPCELALSAWPMASILTERAVIAG